MSAFIMGTSALSGTLSGEGEAPVQWVDQTVYGMGGLYPYTRGSSVPIEDDDEMLDGFLRAVPLNTTVVPVQPDPLFVNREQPVEVNTPEWLLQTVQKAPQVHDFKTLADQEAEALRKKNHNHALRLLLLAS